MLQCEVIGNLGGDAEIKEFGGKKYVSFSVAHTERVRTGIDAYQEQTVWISVLWYGDGGKLLQYLKRGSKVFVRGRQTVKIYTDRNNNAQIAINVNANEVVLCGSKNENNNQGGNVPMSAQQDQAQPLEPSDDLPF